MITQHCKALTKEQREVLDEAAARYGTHWFVVAGSKHNKVYVAEKMVAVLSKSTDRNQFASVHPAIERAMKE
jgi:hypothetical protein